MRKILPAATAFLGLFTLAACQSPQQNSGTASTTDIVIAEIKKSNDLTKVCAGGIPAIRPAVGAAVGKLVATQKISGNYQSIGQAVGKKLFLSECPRLKNAPTIPDNPKNATTATPPKTLAVPSATSAQPNKQPPPTPPQNRETQAAKITADIARIVTHVKDSYNLRALCAGGATHLTPAIQQVIDNLSANQRISSHPYALQQAAYQEILTADCPQFGSQTDTTQQALNPVIDRPVLDRIVTEVKTSHNISSLCTGGDTMMRPAIGEAVAKLAATNAIRGDYYAIGQAAQRHLRQTHCQSLPGQTSLSSAIDKVITGVKASNNLAALCAAGDSAMRLAIGDVIGKLAANRVITGDYYQISQAAKQKLLATGCYP